MNKIEKKYYSDILEQLAVSDQNMRKKFREGRIKWDKKLDKINSDKLKKIIIEIGWPYAKKFGINTEKNAWLIVQHSPYNDFQKECLTLMKKEHGKKKFIAYLEDRILVRDGKKQIYGTQFHIGTDGDFIPFSIYNVKKIENRRKVMGLVSFKKYSKSIIKSFKKHRLYKNI